MLLWITIGILFTAGYIWIGRYLYILSDAMSHQAYQDKWYDVVKYVLLLPIQIVFLLVVCAIMYPFDKWKRWEE